MVRAILSDDQVREAWRWCSESRLRTWDEAARPYGVKGDTLRRRANRLGLFSAYRLSGLTDDVAREAWEWYQAQPERSIRACERNLGVSRDSLEARWERMGLPKKGYRPRQMREADKMVYDRVLEEYRAGALVQDIAASCGIAPQSVLDILEAAGEVCARCRILLARNDGLGIAVLPTGERVCQECVDEARYQVVRWDVPRSNRVRRAL